MPNNSLVYISKPGFEPFAQRELVKYGLAPQVMARGCLSSSCFPPLLKKDNNFDFCFITTALINPLVIKAPSMNACAREIMDLFKESLKDKRIEKEWPFIFDVATEKEGLSQYAKSVEKICFEKIRKNFSRLAKLSTPYFNQPSGFQDGFFVYFLDFNEAWVATRCWWGGQRRMKWDEKSPSRSFLKVEEAYGLLGREPKPGERVVDLGAAPGGWSYSAAKRGAYVIAVDNGPLKGVVSHHDLIEHLRQDAFAFEPANSKRANWLFCDMVEDPHRVLDLVGKWIKNGWCQYLIVNLKIGKADPIVILKKIRDPKHGLIRNCSKLIVRQLYHDREEITLLGEI